METSSGFRRATGTASDIAQILGVSKAAVSYALNGKPGVSAATRREILGIAHTFGIEIPDRAANYGKASPSVGLILADLGNPFYQHLGVEVAERARAHGFNALLAHTGDGARELIATAQSMISHRVDGIILTATQDGDASIAQLLRQSGVPYVQVSRKMPTVRAGFVGIDNRSASRDLAFHMAGHGYKNIALAIGPRRSSASNERHSGFLDGLVESGLSVPHQWIIRTGLGTDGGFAAGRYLRELERGLPEAILCGTDAIAYGIIQDFVTHGIKIPDDVAITGFDGVVGFGAADFELTTAVQPIEAMAEQAVGYLQRLINNEKVPPQDLICDYRLRIGNSCRCQIPQQSKGKQ